MVKVCWLSARIDFSILFHWLNSGTWILAFALKATWRELFGQTRLANFKEIDPDWLIDQPSVAAFSCCFMVFQHLDLLYLILCIHNIHNCIFYDSIILFFFLIAPCAHCAVFSRGFGYSEVIKGQLSSVRTLLGVSCSGVHSVAGHDKTARLSQTWCPTEISRWFLFDRIQ